MKKIITILLTTVMTLSISLTAFAVEIPIESLPHNATHEGMIITENLIGEILTEVKNGLGYHDVVATVIKKLIRAVLVANINPVFPEMLHVRFDSLSKVRDNILG